MNSLNKRDADFQTGKLKREKTAEVLNKYFAVHKIDLLFERNQPLLKTMSIAEKNKNNVLQNYIIPAPFEKAMTLHYSLVRGKRKIPFIFCYKDSSGFYLKLPKEYKEDPDGYLKLLEAFKYNVLIVDEGEGEFKLTGLYKFSQIIPMDLIRKYWVHKISTSKGNTNRLKFYGSMKDVVCMYPDQSGLFSKPLYQALNELF